MKRFAITWLAVTSCALVANAVVPNNTAFIFVVYGAYLVGFLDGLVR